jgi:molecular chaperone DnaJ
MRDFGPFGDIFGAASGARAGPQAGSSLRVSVRLGLEDLVEETEKKVKFKRMARCEACGGTGARDGKALETCPDCGGQGEMRRVHRSFLGQVVNVTVCPRCRGEGRVIKEVCKECGGKGRREVQEAILVKIPAGVSSNNYIPIRGKGNDGPRGGPPGDLHVYIEEEEHPVFERRGADICCDVPISYTQAVLGDKIEVPTLDGTQESKVPAGTQSQRVVRLRGKGLPRLNSRGHGDEYVRTIIWVPTKVSRREKEALQRLAEYEDRERPEPGKGFLSKLRNLLGD